MALEHCSSLPAGYRLGGHLENPLKIRLREAVEVGTQLDNLLACEQALRGTSLGCRSYLYGTILLPGEADGAAMIALKMVDTVELVALVTEIHGEFAARGAN